MNAKTFFGKSKRLRAAHARRAQEETRREQIARHRARGEQQTYSIYKASEGGFGQALALTLLRGEGILAQPATSPYVGQTAVIVYGGKRVQAKAEKILFNY